MDVNGLAFQERLKQEKKSEGELNTEYLAFERVLIDFLIGDVGLAIIVGLLLISYFSQKVGLDWQAMVALGVVFLCVMFGLYTGYLVIWVAVGLIVGTVWYFTIKKLIG